MLLCRQVYGDYFPGDHLFPFRTESLSPGEPMVLLYCGRVGRRREFFTRKKPVRKTGFRVLYPLLLRFTLLPSVLSHGSLCSPTVSNQLAQNILLTSCITTLIFPSSHYLLPFLRSVNFFDLRYSDSRRLEFLFSRKRNYVSTGFPVREQYNFELVVSCIDQGVAWDGKYFF